MNPAGNRDNVIILCGGNLLKSLQRGVFASLVTDLLRDATILLFPFAQQSQGWAEQFANFKALDISRHSRIDWILASEQYEQRQKQITECSVCVLLGGNVLRLREIVRREELQLVCREKTVIASSAGVNILSQHYYSTDRDQYEEGLGIIPFKTMVHYEPFRQAELESLSHIGPQVRVLALAEEEFFILPA